MNKDKLFFIGAAADWVGYRGGDGGECGIGNSGGGSGGGAGPGRPQQAPAPAVAVSVVVAAVVTGCSGVVGERS